MTITTITTWNVTRAISLFALTLLISIKSNAQNVGINSSGAAPAASAMLDVVSTTKGMLIPRMTTAQKNAITSPATGLLVFDTSLGAFYYYNGSAWVPLLDSTTGWELDGNAGTTAGTDYVGTTDAVDLVFKTNGTEQMRIQSDGDVGVGTATPGALLDISGGPIWQTSTGKSVIIGENAGAADDLTDNLNVYVGYDAGKSNVSSINNVAVGYQALMNSIGTAGVLGYNTAVGSLALTANTEGYFNTSVGNLASQRVTTGIENTSLGHAALENVTTASSNTAIGSVALQNCTGANNTALGKDALWEVTSGTNNIGIGYYSGTGGAASSTKITTGSYCIFIGDMARFPNLTQRNNAIAIGKNSQVNASNTMVLGGSGADAVNVGIGTSAPSYQLQLSTNSAGKPTSSSWTITSDRRLKKDIRAYEAGLEDVLKLEPVWFTYTGEAGLPQETGVGVIAQDLEKIAPYMIKKWRYRAPEGEEVTPDKEYLGVDNGPMTYMLINAVKEQQVMIEALQKQNEEQQKLIEELLLQSK